MNEREAAAPLAMKAWTAGTSPAVTGKGTFGRYGTPAQTGSLTVMAGLVPAINCRRVTRASFARGAGPA